MVRNIVILLSFFLLSCARSSTELEEALNLAGDNRKELESVLKHYSHRPEDSLKLKAARFLIANMPGHWSYNEEQLTAYYAETDPIVNSTMTWREKVNALNIVAEKHADLFSNTTEDIKIIKADYLIRSIDHAFSAWKEKPWARHVVFDDFCEYLLPYKIIDGQPLDGWRDTLDGWLDKGLDLYKDNQHFKNSPYRAGIIFRERLQRQVRPVLNHDFNGIPLMSSSNMKKMPAGTCQEYSTLAMAVMRSNGIPVASDFVRQWPCQDGRGHSWNILLSDTRKEMVFEDLCGVGIGGFLRPDTKLAKVYRTTYAINRDLQQLRRKEKHVPDFFSGLFIRDVTDKYISTTDITINILPGKNLRNEYAYLAIFAGGKWNPTAFGKRNGNAVRYEQTGNDIVYLPCFYTDEGVSPFNYPFLLEYSGNCRFFIPDTSVRRKVILHRKYPVFTPVYNATLRTLGAKIQASDFEDFRDSVTMHTINTWQAAGKFYPETSRAYRYWRYISPDKGHCNIAELMFYTGNNKVPLYGRIIGTDEIWQNDSVYSKEKVFDGDPLTYFNAASPDGAWVGLDFGKPVRIEKIIALPRSDDNNIRIGDVYELFYREKDGWISLGVQKAMDLHLIFDNVPDNALLWLRDHTRGIQERIFSYENGEQVWW